jgi:hypothetical protein
LNIGTTGAAANSVKAAGDLVCGGELRTNFGNAWDFGGGTSGARCD